MKKIDVAVVGASGYTGLELIKLLINHEKFNLKIVATTEGDTTIDKVHPCLKDVCSLKVTQANAKEISESCQLAFLALPHKTAMSFVKELISLQVKVVDLSADYRISLDAYEKHYGKHLDIENINHAIYGLPELNRENIKTAKLVANPGCYPTASILAILPFKKYIKKQTPIFIDAKSGVSGAGKKLTNSSHFVNINENFVSYNVLKHRHEPEISEHLSLQNTNNQIHFVPHLLPITRGMLVSAYMQIDTTFNAYDILCDFYKDEKFVRVRDENVSVKQTVGTNFCDIYAVQKDNILFVSSSIDNLLRGASSQALVNANLMFGFDEDLGIPRIAYVP